jgi:hypothetical protein
MNRLAFPALCALLLAVQAGCGAEPETSSGTPSPLQGLQPIPFSGVVDPAAARMQLVAAPQAALGVIPEDNNGNPATVAVGTVQVYGPSVAFTNTIPGGCTSGGATYMTSSVQVFSGFTEQLRNVYAKITTLSGGQTFCNKDPVGNFGTELSGNKGLVLYQPLDAGTNASSAISRSTTWAMKLPDNGPFWFSGELWAEVIPQPPTPTTPADGAVLHAGTGNNTLRVRFAWTLDPAANGSNPEGFVVSRPNNNGSELTIYRCGAAPGTYDPLSCTTAAYGPTARTLPAANVRLATGFFYQWRLRARFNLPGGNTTIGTLNSTRYLQVVP